MFEIDRDDPVFLTLHLILPVIAGIAVLILYVQAVGFQNPMELPEVPLETSVHILLPVGILALIHTIEIMGSDSMLICGSIDRLFALMALVISFIVCCILSCVEIVIALVAGSGLLIWKIGSLIADHVRC